MGQVIKLKSRRKAKPNPLMMGVLFDEAFAAFPRVGRIRSSRILAAPEWQKSLLLIDEGSLLEAVQRYAREDTEHKKECGAPGFHRWLAWGRWEHWLPPEASKPKEFSDAILRDSFHQRFADEKARKWFDNCSLLGETIIMGWPPKQEWAEGPFTKWAIANGLKGWRLK